MDKEFWNVSNVGLVAYLMCDFQIVNTEVKEINGRKKVDFVFKNSEELHLAIKDFKDNDFLQKFNDNMIKVKDKIYKARTGTNE